MSNGSEFDLGILGAGPGGYVAAIRAAQLGLKTALVEKDAVGGVCLNRGCIPTKALLKAAEVVALIRRSEEFGVSVGQVTLDFKKVMARKNQVIERLRKGIEFLVGRNKVELVRGVGSIAGTGQIAVKGESGERVLKCTNILIATGSRPKSLPGLTPDGKTILTSDHMMILEEVPPTLAIIGAGAIGVEFASMFSAFGSKVTLIEALPAVLPLEDEDVSAELTRAFKKRGIKVFTGAQVAQVREVGGQAEIKLSVKGKEETVTASKVLVSVGRAPVTDGLGLEKLGVALEKGAIKVDQWQQTSQPRIYAIGDVTGRWLLAHVASAEGVVAVERIAGKNIAPVNYEAIPCCTYSEPQVASLGLSEKKAVERGIKVKVGKFPFMASGKAIANGATEGFVKVVADEKHGEILGVQMVGAEATELIAEVGLAKALECTASEIARTIHAHPTLSEALAEAAHAVHGAAIHV